MTKVDAKVVLLGKEYSGKTSLIERFLHARFCGDEVPYQNTIGAGYGAKRLDVFGREVFLGIWDTAGSERYQAMSKIYYRSAWAAVVCYDLTDISSWEKAKFWVSELRNNEPNCKVYYCGTKLDLIERDPSFRNVDSRAVQEFAIVENASPTPQFSSTTSDVSDDESAPTSTTTARIFETSSKTGEGVRDVFVQIAKDFVKESKERATSASSSSSHWNSADAAFGLDNKNGRDSSSCKC